MCGGAASGTTWCDEALHADMAVGIGVPEWRDMVRHGAMRCDMSHLVRHESRGATWVTWCDMSHMVRHESRGET